MSTVGRDRVVALALATLLLGLLAGALEAEEKVAFNVESKKYHCLECRHALACTRNCIVIPLSEAKRRGGLPCKVCRGTCDRGGSAAAPGPPGPDRP